MQRSVSASTLMNDGRATIGLLPEHKYAAVGNPYRDTCGKCGARRIDRQIGLEATPDEYLQTLVQVFREVRRVLRDDGTCWVNMGDSYASSGISGVQSTTSNLSRHGANGFNPKMDGQVFGRAPTPSWAKPKDQLMMPARLALALQADGWWLRSDIIWAKPNPMPESVTDRPTSAHEHVFLLSKNARYYYDADAVREEADEDRAGGPMRMSARRSLAIGRDPSGNEADPSNGIRPATRNLRNVWTIATAPFPEAHFATFPPELAERCIKAGTSARGCCAQCGAPWVRQTDVSHSPADRTRGKPGAGSFMASGAGNKQGGWNDYPSLDKHVTTTGWLPGCQCDAATKPCTVLDPFAGAGTTMLVADRLQRHAIGIELNEAYAAMSRNRVYADAPLLAEACSEERSDVAVAD